MATWPILIVEIFNNGLRCAMATMNFSIPDDVKEAFKAIEERERSHRSGDFVERLRRIRASGREVTDGEIKRGAPGTQRMKASSTRRAQLPHLSPTQTQQRANDTYGYDELLRS
jgi:hypothetical protein